MATRPYRLPGNVRPESYTITLDARLGRDTFTGRVRIALDVAEATREIEIHAHAIDVASVELVAGGRTLAGTAVEIPEVEAIRLTFEDDVPPGPAELTIRYTGHVSRNMEGLYLSKNGPEECLASQCQETDARAVFPCFDEPAFKARFQWIVTTDATHEVLSNGVPESVIDHGDGSRRWTFTATRPISTYLLALAIGDFAHGKDRSVNGIPLRVFGLRGKEHLGEYSNGLTARLLPWFEEYFGVPYPYGKYDQLAVPSFSAGAMENVGLVLFRENLLLLDEATASWRETKAVARVVAHEFAHMWFGNLVTMQWWDDIWLNEAFAEWMAHRSIHAVHPDYHVWDDFQASKAGALESDALASTHPIYSPVETPQQATELFDAITYQKGSAVMRMLENFLGADAFRDGLRTYMQEFKESNAKGDDLWRHLEAASGQPVGRVMGQWIREGGYPVVSVARAPDGALSFAQKRFLVRPDATPSDTLWPVPLVIRYADDDGVHTVSHLLDGAEGRVELPVSGTLKWAIPNGDGVGFYRLDMADPLIASALDHIGELATAEIVGLLDDAWALVQNGTHTVDRFLRVLDKVADGATNPSVLGRVAQRARDLEGRLENAGDAAALESFRAWLRERLSPALDRLGLEPASDEDPLTADARAVLLELLAGSGGEARAKAHALALQRKESSDPAGVPPELAAPAVRVAARYGDAAHFEEHLATYDERRASRAPPQTVQRYLYTLADHRDPALMDRLVGLMEDGTIPQEALGPMLRLMFSLRQSRSHAWTYLTRNWSTVREKLGDMWTGFLVEASGHLPATRRAEVVAFYDTNLKGVAQQAYARALERMDQEAEFDARTRDGIAAWFAARS